MSYAHDWITIDYNVVHSFPHSQVLCPLRLRVSACMCVRELTCQHGSDDYKLLKYSALPALAEFHFNIASIYLFIHHIQATE